MHATCHANFPVSDLHAVAYTWVLLRNFTACKHAICYPNSPLPMHIVGDTWFLSIVSLNCMRMLCAPEFWVLGIQLPLRTNGHMIAVCKIIAQFCSILLLWLFLALERRHCPGPIEVCQGTQRSISWREVERIHSKGKQSQRAKETTRGRNCAIALKRQWWGSQWRQLWNGWRDHT